MITITPIFVARDNTNQWVPTDEKFTREEAAEKLGIGRTTLWRYEKRIVLPANILDYHRYKRQHPKHLDWYCIFILSRAMNHFQGEGSYQAAREVMYQQRELYTRANFDAYVQDLIAKNQSANQRRVSA